MWLVQDICLALNRYLLIFAEIHENFNFMINYPEWTLLLLLLA